jgi:DNA polymerase II large subunit
MSPSYKQYFKELEDKLLDQYKIADKARAKGIDPVLKPEPEITRDIPDRIEKLLGPPGISKRMRELEDMDRREMAFKIAGEIALGRFGHRDKGDAAEQAIRTGLGILTEGVTIAPIQGIPEITIKKQDGNSYLSISFAGPIRPAGGTAQALTLVLADYVRKQIKLDRYQPSDDVVGRFIEEVRLYERNVRRFQYHVTDEDLEVALKNIPIEATGVSTDRYEVSNYRNISGIDTNRLRGGALIVVVDGVVGRARKLYGICENLGFQGWEWLKRMGKKKSNTLDKKPTAGFMEEIIVGRPVFSFPGAVGGFRLRYGRARTTGLAAAGLHPATMMILNNFIVTGVQLRVELPGKSAAICPVTSIEPPVVKLINGDVERVNSVERASNLLEGGKIDEILFNGDILFNAGDFLQNNKPLLPSGYDENQWQHSLSMAFEKFGGETCFELTGIPKDRIDQLLTRFSEPPTPEEAIALTEIDVPLHPQYTYHWSKINKGDLNYLRTYLLDNWQSQEGWMKNEFRIKEILENLLIPHKIRNNRIILNDLYIILEHCLSLDQMYVDIEGDESLEVVNKLADFPVKEKAPIFVGARMGRPEKAKERKMSPYVHCLYPVAEAGGSQRNIMKSKRGQRVRVELVRGICPQCGKVVRSPICPDCQVEAVEDKSCMRCGVSHDGDICPSCGSPLVMYETVDIDLYEEIHNARKELGIHLPDRIKCVKRLMNEKKVPEHLGKGILRGHFDLSVFKDGTLRYDATDIPLTHFKPDEVGVSVDRLRTLGYTHDKEGKPLTDPVQMLELKVQDIILPEDCGDYLVNASKFLDMELELLYGLEPYYKAEGREDLIGEIILGLAPHTSAAIVGRIIGYSKVKNCYAHPYWHAGKRRNCDGDEDGIMFTLDALLNFSRTFLPEQSGGLMDAPLLIIPNLNPSEVDKEAHNVDVISRYPPAFYQLASTGGEPKDYGPLLDTLGGRLGMESQYEGFDYTEECSDINLGGHPGAYTMLGTMLEKLESQLDLTKKLISVDAKTVALKILNSHFLKDIMGNLRAFTSQGFRCSKCNRKYRRPPLAGKCNRCGGPIILTVHKGGIEKYLEPAKNLVKDYDLDQYYADRLCLIEEEINSLFADAEEEPTTQFNLINFMTKRE